MSPEFLDLFSKNAGTAFAKQLAFADHIGQGSWGIDLGVGRITFGSDLSYPLQILGSESDGDGSWLWAWANHASNLPEPLLAVSKELNAFGEKEGIKELVERSFSAQEVNGHLLSMVASGMNQNTCYYRAPYDGGAMYLLVCDVPNELTKPVATERAITVLSQVISQFDVEHKIFVNSFLSQQNFELETNNDVLSAKRESNEIVVSFDAEGRIANIEGKLGQQSAPDKKKKSWQFWKK